MIYQTKNCFLTEQHSTEIIIQTSILMVTFLHLGFLYESKDMITQSSDIPVQHSRGRNLQFCTTGSIPSKKK